jgi:CRP/FNR family transcriptional regulator, cyclic AMP receptor protein
MTANSGCSLGEEVAAPQPSVQRQRSTRRDAKQSYNCPSCPLRSAGYFCDLSVVTLQSLQQIRHSHRYAAGRKIFVQGQRPRGVFMVCQGRVKLTMSSIEGKALILRLVRSGEILGLGCVMSGGRHEFTAETLDDCRISFVDRDAFRQFIRQHNDACARVIQQLASKCSAARNRVRSLVFSRSAESRLARLLLDWSTADFESGGQAQSVMPPLSHGSVAEMIGTSRETVTRLLKKLKHHRIVEIIGQHITIRDATALKVVASKASSAKGFSV